MKSFPEHKIKSVAVDAKHLAVELLDGRSLRLVWSQRDKTHQLLPATSDHTP